MKELRWIASVKDDLLALPAMVVREIGHALYLAQLGTKHSDTKPLRGFGDAASWRSLKISMEIPFGRSTRFGLLRLFMFFMSFRRNRSQE